MPRAALGNKHCRAGDAMTAINSANSFVGRGPQIDVIFRRSCNRRSFIKQKQNENFNYSVLVIVDECQCRPRAEMLLRGGLWAERPEPHCMSGRSTYEGVEVA
jgi:hypothetical protein